MVIAGGTSAANAGTNQQEDAAVAQTAGEDTVRIYLEKKKGKNGSRAVEQRWGTLHLSDVERPHGVLSCRVVMDDREQKHVALKPLRMSGQITADQWRVAFKASRKLVGGYQPRPTA